MTVRYQRHPNVRITALEGEGVVLHLDTRRYFTLNSTGLVLLEAMAEPRTLDELVASLVREFAVGDREARSTAEVFLRECAARGVVQTVGA